ncbi:MAG: spermidine synthase, partial [Candidatus Binatia bacterium]
FIGCMVCHGELARLRPAPAGLTGFYLASASGGALGALFVGIVAPRLFAGYWELLFASAAILPLALLAASRDPTSPLAPRRHAVRRTAALLAAGFIVAIVLAIRSSTVEARVAARNFYGVLRVTDEDTRGGRLRTFTHGVTNHGAQLLDAGRRREPTAYYGRSSGVGLAFARLDANRPRRVGIVGLGAGNLATYGRPGDRFRFYEINPLVIEIAEREFSFLADGRAETEVALGDARLVLGREEPQRYDLLVVDAFSSDSIPIHCLTREAFALYLRHLAPGGVLAIHISNRHLDLEPVVAAAARSLAQPAVVVESAGAPEQAILPAVWILVGGERALLDDAEIRAASRPVGPREVAWTDDHSSLLQVLR